MRNISFVLCVIVSASLMGCAGNHEAIAKISAGARHDIFQVTSASLPVSGKALLQIEFSVKAYKARVLNPYIKHGDPPYNVVINIDDQVIELMDEPVLGVCRT